MKLFLLGDSKTDWQRSLINECKLRSEEHNRERFDFIDPNHFPVSDIQDEYGVFCMETISQSDIIFVHIEENSQNLIEIATLTGFAKALGKTVILVLQSNNIYIEDKYLDFIRMAASIVFTDFGNAVDYVNDFQLPF